MERIWYKSYNKETAKNINYPNILLFELLIRSAQNYPENNALIFMGNKISYRELDALTDRFAANLINLGVEKGDRVALFLPNCPQYIIAVYGILKAGAIFVPNNPLLSEEQLFYQIKNSEAKTIITLDLEMFYPKVLQIQKRFKLQNIIVSSLKKRSFR